MTTGFMCYIHEGDVIRGVICSLYMDTAWYSDLVSRSISLEYDIITQPAMRYLAFAISSDNASWEVLHVQDTQNVTGMASVTIPDTYDGTVKLGLKLFDAPPTVGSILNVGFDYVTTGGISVSTTQNGKTVTMTCATQGAVIRYTVDGSDPTEQSTEYAGEFVIDHDCTVKAKAWKDGLEPSDIVSKTVEIPVPVPVVTAWRQTASVIPVKYRYFYQISNTTDYPVYFSIQGASPNEGFVNPAGWIQSVKNVGNPSPYVDVYECTTNRSKRTRGWRYGQNVPVVTTSPFTFTPVPLSSIQLLPPTISHDNALVTITNQFPAEVEHIYYKIGSGEYQEYTGPFQITTSGRISVTAYCTGTGYEDSNFITGNFDISLPLSVGDIVSVDGIETLVLAVKDDSGAWVSTAGAQGTECIGVDRKHDLSYYISGDDYVNLALTTDNAPMCAYEWGGKGTETGNTHEAVGDGDPNTSIAISLNLQPDTEGWPVLWDKVAEFRQSHSDKWFVPSHGELALICNNKANLDNLTIRSDTVNIQGDYRETIVHSYYWSSTEYNSEYAKAYKMYNSADSRADKSNHRVRTRLCVQFDSSDAEIIDNEEIDMIKKTFEFTLTYNESASDAGMMYFDVTGDMADISALDSSKILFATTNVGAVNGVQGSISPTEIQISNSDNVTVSWMFKAMVYIKPLNFIFIPDGGSSTQMSIYLEGVEESSFDIRDMSSFIGPTMTINVYCTE